MQNLNYQNIKSFEDACSAKGVNPEEFIASLISIGETADKIAEKKLELFASAVNGDWKATYKDGNRKKWFPVFWYSPSGFVLDIVYCHYVSTFVSPRLCFETADQARHAAAIMLKDYEIYYS